MIGWEVLLVVTGMVAATVTGGAFFVFSNFVMRALGALGDQAGAAAMQSINRFAPNPLFVVLILGGVVAGIPVAAFGNTGADRGYVAAGVLLSLVSLLVTLTVNIPKNNELDRHDPAEKSTATYWRSYFTSWTRANTMRGLASTAAGVAYALALIGATA